jgi:predicted ATPase
MIKKIEEGERRPSKELALLLARHLALAEAERPVFVALARGQVIPDLAPPGPAYLPAPLTSFVGRSDELNYLTATLVQNDVRLLTLTGAPGVGKTRLALRAASELRAFFPDGVWFVPLATVDDPQLVALAIVRALSIQPRTALGKEFLNGSAPTFAEDEGMSSQPALAQLTHWLGNRRLLLVLDNFEQMLDAANDIFHLLTCCADLKILVTSRVPLQLYGEHRFTLPPLPTPPAAQWSNPEQAAAYPAVQLLLARLRAHQPDFQWDHANSAALAEICARLDGLPLAIELAAAQLAQNGPTLLRDQLIGAGRLGLLTTTARGMQPHQQTLRTAIDWSFRLLAPADQRLFARLGIFSGEFDLAAVVTVAHDPSTSFATVNFATVNDESSSDEQPHDKLQCDDENAGLKAQLQGLADHHLLEARRQDGQRRYVLLETLRDYALEQLTAEAKSTLRHRHASYYATMAQAVDPAQTAGDLQTWRAELRRNHANLLAALQWAIHAPEPALALQLAVGLGHYLYLEGHWQEGVHWLQAVVAAVEDDDTAPALQARVQTALGILYSALGRYPEADQQLQTALRQATFAGDRMATAWTLSQLAHTALLVGDSLRARTYAHETLPLYRALDDRRYLALSLERLGCAALEEGNYAEGMPWLEECLEIYRRLQSPGGTGSTLNLLGMAELAMGHDNQALAHFSAAYAEFDRIQHTHGLPWTLRNLGLVQLCLGDTALAQNYFLAALERYDALVSQDGAISVVEGIAGVAARCRQPALAAHLFGAAAAQRERAGLPVSINSQQIYARILAPAQAALPDWEEAVTAGRTLPWGEAIRMARELPIR